MDTGEFGTQEVKKEVDPSDFNEDFPTAAVKLEPCHSEVCEGISTIGCDTAQVKNENNIDIFYEDIKCEIKEEISSGLYKFCEVCIKSFSGETEFIDSKNNTSECSCLKQNDLINLQAEDINQDVKPDSLGLNTDFGLQQLIVQDETRSADECNVSPEALRRDSVSPSKDNQWTASKMRDNFLVSKHQITDKLETKLHCKTCSKSLCSARNLKAHERVHTGEKLFHCLICSKSLISNSSLKAHIMIHTGEKSFHCQICSKSFVSSSSLKAHIKTHTREKPYYCKVCSKSFGFLDKLKIHERIHHTGEKPFNCKVCSKSFHEKSSLNGHLNIHTGEKLLYCRVCSKSFIHRSKLEIHGRIHSGEKPFQCKVCSKYFITRSSLNVHMKIHTGEKPFSCSNCSKSFIYRNKLIVHERIHTGEKPFHCKVCSKSFSGKSYLNAHLKMHSQAKTCNG